MVRCINNHGEIHSGSGKNEGTEDKTRKTTNGLSLNTAKHNSVMPSIPLLRAVSQRKGIRGTVYETASIGMKYSVRHSFYQQDHYYYSALHPRAVKRHFVVVLFLFYVEL